MFKEIVEWFKLQFWWLTSVKFRKTNRQINIHFDPNTSDKNKEQVNKLYSMFLDEIDTTLDNSLKGVRDLFNLFEERSNAQKDQLRSAFWRLNNDPKYKELVLKHERMETRIKEMRKALN